jgi:transcription initiation factor IIF auxiliary subunit
MTSLKTVQSQSYRGDNYWDWAVWLDGQSDELDEIAFVEYTLHPTFPKPVRRIVERDTNFKLTTSGWGEFTIYLRVVFKDKREESLSHHLELVYPDTGTRTAL